MPVFSPIRAIPPQMIISLPVHTAVCPERGSIPPGVRVHVSGSHGVTAVIRTGANSSAAGARWLLNEGLRPAHQASNAVFGQEAVAVVTASASSRRIAV